MELVGRSTTAVEAGKWKGLEQNQPAQVFSVAESVVVTNQNLG
jgi:hypothetical protein